jgi:multidrug efflux system membrane fusion protein
MQDKDDHQAGAIVAGIPKNGDADAALAIENPRREMPAENRTGPAESVPVVSASASQAPLSPTSSPSAGPSPSSLALARTRRRTVLTLIGLVVAFFGIWWLADQFFAYTDDAYVNSDVIPIAPEVTGPVIAVHIQDNQWLKRGDPLVSIDPKPFQIAVNQAHAELLQAQAQLPIDQAQLDAAQDQMKSAQNDLNLANIELKRMQTLTTASVTDQQSLDVATARARDAVARLDGTTAALAQAGGMLHLHERAVETARAVLDMTQWRLDRTEIRAPADGPVNHLTVRVGDMAVAHEPLLAVVDADSWRVEANYKERFLHHFRPGMTAWVWLDAVPGHWYRARIQGMAHAIERRQAVAGLVPYVSPTVDWIRLTRRVPVRLEFVDPPPDIHLFMGTDARVIVLY